MSHYVPFPRYACVIDNDEHRSHHHLLMTMRKRVDACLSCIVLSLTCRASNVAFVV